MWCTGQISKTVLILVLVLGSEFHYVVAWQGLEKIPCKNHFIWFSLAVVKKGLYRYTTVFLKYGFQYETIIHYLHLVVLLFRALLFCFFC